ncbi:hypothetical protein IZY60_10745 [Lutibacter sp. B2]|nr:hypothetical protein [Lutibacter sp. B2]
MKKFILLCICSLIFFTACGQGDNGTIKEEVKESYSSNEEIWNISTQVMHALKDKDMSKIADFVHPTKGLLLSPDAFIQDETVQVLTKEMIINFFEDENLYTWGYEDGSGDPMELTKKAYYERWMYDKDFINADQIGINTMIGQGNSTSSIEKISPKASFVAYHFKGFDKNVGGLDWESIYLVFEKYENQWYLVGIVHDHWTI